RGARPPGPRAPDRRGYALRARAAVRAARAPRARRGARGTHSRAALHSLWPRPAALPAVRCARAPRGALVGDPRSAAGAGAAHPPRARRAGGRRGGDPMRQTLFLPARTGQPGAPIAVETITSPQGIRSLRGEWTDLLAESAADCLFLTWEWLSTWWNHL